MFTKSAELYDLFYAWKDYAAEARQVHAIVQQHVPGARALLDIACGTGQHLEHLSRHYLVEGVDIDDALLEIARGRLSHTPLHQADMVSFSLGRHFDAVTCLFSSVGYLTSVGSLERALSRMAAHLRPGGLLLVEPWFDPEEWSDGHIGALFVDESHLKAARMNVGSSEGRKSILDFHYLVARGTGIEHFTESHTLYLFTHAEYNQALARAGLEVSYDAEGLEGRGLYLGRKPENAQA